MELPQKAVLVIHGGAGHLTGELITSKRQAECRDAIKTALEAGLKVIKSGGPALDAVEQAVKVMEDCPLFNAGRGSVFNSSGVIEMDAAIMDGRTLSAGAISAVHKVKNPVSAARAVMERTQHVLISGAGAELLALECGLELMESEYFKTEDRWQQHLTCREETEALATKQSKKHGTVGSVAVDSRGNLAAATSTGGTNCKMIGRVGDSPIIGAGTYADNNSCAVSATGHGEFFMRYVVAYDMAALMNYKHYSVQQAAEEIINGKLKKAGGEGGLIAIDKDGNFAMPYNTQGMYRGCITAGGDSFVAIFDD